MSQQQIQIQPLQQMQKQPEKRKTDFRTILSVVTMLVTILFLAVFGAMSVFGPFSPEYSEPEINIRAKELPKNINLETRFQQSLPKSESKSLEAIQNSSSSIFE